MENETINYLELPSSDLQQTKHFFTNVFQWQFTDYGPDYTAFSATAGMAGGFYLAELSSKTASGACLIVFYSKALDKTQEKIIQYGGTIVKPTFEFPGGRRFHFSDPTGNEFAVWSE